MLTRSSENIFNLVQFTGKVVFSRNCGEHIIIVHAYYINTFYCVFIFFSSKLEITYLKKLWDWIFFTIEHFFYD